MSTPYLRRVIGDNYVYQYLPSEFSDKEINKYRASILEQAAKLTKNWTDDLHSEWTARIFFAAKMIYSSTLLLNSLAYSQKKSIRVTEPYLLYYSMLNCCRSLNLTLPTELWRDGEILHDSHARIINVASDAVTKLNKAKGEQLSNFLSLARDYREMFSYRFPANGLQDPLFSALTIDAIIKNCAILCEIAQLTSELFEQSFDRDCSSGSYKFKDEILTSCFTYFGKNVTSYDVEDAYRLSFTVRKVHRPHNIYHTMTAGMTDDFFGSWYPEAGAHGDVFNPDKRTINIFELP